MRHIPSTIVFSLLALVVASWPGVQTWADLDIVNHYLVHALYLVSGGLLGLQTAWWIHRHAPIPQYDDKGVSS